MKIRFSILLLAALLAGATLLSGCSANFTPMALQDDADTPQTPVGEINGSVHGGQSPITGAQIYLFAAATNGYAAASKSLITNGKPGVTCNTSGTLNGDCYVLTDNLGNFSLGGDYTCTPGTQVYMVAAGGNPGVGIAAPFSTTATVTRNSKTITVTSATGITTGMAVTGTGIASGAAVTAIAGRTITLSQNSTANGTNVSVTFSTTTATWAANSWTIGVTSAAGVSVGNVVVGSGVSGTVTAVSGTTIALSQPLSTSGSSVPVTFSTPQSNSAIVQMVGLGQCPSAGNLAAQVPFLVINEVTTVAFAYAMGGFGTDAYHIGSSGTPLALTAIANAMTNFTNIVGIGWGGALPATNANSNSVAPQAKINMLANIVATCINTATSTSGSCANLFANAKNGTTTPTDESTALFNIVHNPDANASALFNLYLGNSIFSPMLSSAPSDWTMPVVYKNAVSRPSKIAFDSMGNAWIADRTLNAVIKTSPQGVITKIQPPGAGSLYDVAVDPSNVVWAVDFTNNEIYRLDSSGNVLSTITTGSLNQPTAISFDSSGNAYVTNAGSTVISRYNSSGIALSGTVNSNATLGSSYAIAIDANGNQWLPGYGTNCACMVELNVGSTVGTLFNNAPIIILGYVEDSTAVAVDGSNTPWVANVDNHLLSIQTINLGFLGDFVYNTVNATGGGLNVPSTLSIDGAGNLWTANSGAATVSGFTNAGTALATNGFQSGGTGHTYAAAPDGSGNLWTANSDGTVVQILGLATPTATPVVPGQLGTTP